jgi:hypothetical protein
VQERKAKEEKEKQEGKRRREKVAREREEKERALLANVQSSAQTSKWGVMFGAARGRPP